MANVKLSAVSGNTAPKKNGLLYYVDDPTGTPVSYSVTVENFLNGWIGVNDTWTFATANTINVPTDATTTYTKGMKIRFKQGGSFKYMVITVVATTLLTVTGGTDFTVANSSITNVAYSPAEQPLGFPHTFACGAPTWDTATIDNGTGGQQPTAGSQYFSISGNIVDLRVVLGSTNVVKNGAGLALTFSALPGTLPVMTDVAVAPIGYAFIGTINTLGVVILNTGTNGSIEASASIADNTSIVFTGMSLRYKY